MIKEKLLPLYPTEGPFEILHGPSVVLPTPPTLSASALSARDHAELLHEGCRIDYHPMVDNLSILHPVGDMDGHIPGFPGCRHIHEWTLVRATCPTNDRDQVIFGDQLFDLHSIAGEGRFVYGNVVFKRLLGHILIHELRRLGFATE